MFFAVTTQKAVLIAHSDTHRIALRPDKSIPDVSDGLDAPNYPSGMATNNRWLDWGMRLRAHVKERKDVSWTKIAEKLDTTEGAVRHWCNGTRDINLKDFFRLCEVAEADAPQILFGRVSLGDVQKKQLGELVASVLESDPSVAPHYARLIGGIQQDKPGPKKKS